MRKGFRPFSFIFAIRTRPIMKEIKEILKKCRTRTNQCINEQKTKIRNKKKEKDKADSKRNTENVKNFNAQTQKSTIPKL